MSESSYGNPGDDFPSNARYGVMCVEGYSAAAGSYDRSTRTGSRWGFDFYVVDTVQEGEVVAKFTAIGRELDERKVQNARRRAQKQAAKLNSQDKVHDRRVNAAL